MDRPQGTLCCLSTSNFRCNGSGCLSLLPVTFLGLIWSCELSPNVASIMVFMAATIRRLRHYDIILEYEMQNSGFPRALPSISSVPSLCTWTSHKVPGAAAAFLQQ